MHVKCPPPSPRPPPTAPHHHRHLPGTPWFKVRRLSKELYREMMDAGRDAADAAISSMSSVDSEGGLQIVGWGEAGGEGQPGE